MAVAWLKYIELHIPFLHYRMLSRRSHLQQDTYFRVLRMLNDNPDLTQREIAERLGVSTSGMNYCLNALIDKGWVKVQNFSKSKNKFGYIYLLTPEGVAEKSLMTSHFLARKMDEYKALKAEINSLKRGVDSGFGEKQVS
jgi:EPS-associated MarR family transcriptional regulator